MIKLNGLNEKVRRRAAFLPVDFTLSARSITLPLLVSTTAAALIELFNFKLG
jgi:hypothetical protein